MITQKGWEQYFMISDYKKEGSYDAGVTMNSTNASGRRGFDIDVTWDDNVVNDKDLVTGYEHGTDQEINTTAIKLLYKEPRARPNSVNAAFARALGDITAQQDGAFTAYRQTIVPIAVGTALPSAHAEHKKAGIQYKYTGLKTNMVKVSGEAGGFVSLEEELIGSGTRATSATAFADIVSESWIGLRNCKVWMESGTDISIAANDTQGSEDISSATPDDLAARLKSFEFSWNNKLEGQGGFGGGGVFSDLDYGRREASLSFTMLFLNSNDLGYFLAQNPMAIEFDIAGAIIDAGGSYKYGFTLRIPRFKITAAPLAQGGVNDFITVNMTADIQDDGTNSVVIFEGYSAKTGYCAA